MAETVQVIDTGMYADSVEWCPHGEFHDLLLCGTYQLDQSQESACSDLPDEQNNEKEIKTQSRFGNLQMYKLDHSTDMQSSLKKIYTQDMPGILDIKWNPELMDGRPGFGLVNSVGTLEVYVVEQKDGCNDKIFKLTTAGLGDNVLRLSLDWSNRIVKGNPHISTTSSDGHVHVHLLESGGVTPVSSWKAHDYEAWITAFNYWDTNTIFTGGDDCRLKGWDLRQDPTLPTFSSKRHEMGVCSIQSCPVRQHLLCTGSYDEHLLVWDSRHMKSPLADISLGGGIWRVKWEPNTGMLILTATMYNGFHVVDCSCSQEGKLNVLHHYNDNVSLGYGADWCYNNLSSSRNNLVATCSFYNHSLQLWQFPPIAVDTD